MLTWRFVTGAAWLIPHGHINGVGGLWCLGWWSRDHQDEWLAICGSFRKSSLKLVLIANCPKTSLQVTHLLWSCCSKHLDHVPILQSTLSCRCVLWSSSDRKTLWKVICRLIKFSCSTWMLSVWSSSLWNIKLHVMYWYFPQHRSNAWLTTEK